MTRDDTGSWPTRKQVAARFSVSEATVSRWLRDKRLTRYKRYTQGLRYEVVFDPKEIAALEAEIQGVQTENRDERQ